MFVMLFEYHSDVKCLLELCIFELKGYI